MVKVLANSNIRFLIFESMMEPSIFPENFLSSMANEPGFDVENFKNAHAFLQSPTSVRINPNKKAIEKIEQTVPWCHDGSYLESRPSFTFDPHFHAGCYYVQEASSMFIDHIFKFIRPDFNDTIKVLDLCAAPGGKSTLISSALNDGDLLVANEIIKTRVPVLCDNLNRWGKANTIISNNDPKDFVRLNGFFNMILVDAPCSGSGMFRKDPDAMNEWSDANVNLCHQRQERILADIYPALNEDGYLIYSTCSYSHQENEAILDWLCDTYNMESIRIPIYNEWGIVETQSEKNGAWGYRFYPGKVKGEGLFAACLQKKEKSNEPPFFRNKNNQKLDQKDLAMIRSKLIEPEEYYLFKVADDWMAINHCHKDSMDILQRQLYLKKSGVRIGKLIGNDLIPDHEFALSLIIDKESFINTPLDLPNAIKYLQRENMDQVFEGKGWSLMTYEGFVLGWAKLLPGRINNYYPKEIRILSPQPPKGGV